MNKRYVVILVNNPDNPKEYLMGIRRDNGKANFPAGGVNDQEDPKAAAERELMEETGFKAKSLRSIGCYRKDRQGKPVLIYIYRAEIEGTPSLENDPDREFQSISWRNPFLIPSSELHIPPDENSGLKALVEKSN